MYIELDMCLCGLQEVQTLLAETRAELQRLQSNTAGSPQRIAALEVSPALQHASGPCLACSAPMASQAFQACHCNPSLLCQSLQSELQHQDLLSA